MKTKDKIIESAIKAFAEKGFFGTGMEEIASLAGINKAMVYYYFSNKDNLYKEVLSYIFDYTFSYIENNLQDIDIEKEKPEKIIKSLLYNHFIAFNQNPSFSKIVYQAIVNSPDLVNLVKTELKQKSHLSMIKKLERAFERGVNEKVFRNIQPKYFFLIFLGSGIINFMGKYMAHSILDISVKNEKSFDEGHFKSVFDILMNGILIQ